MAKVSLGGRVLMDDDEGNFSYAGEPFSQTSRGFVPMGRAGAIIPRELATVGAEHVVTMRFYGMDAGVVASRLEGAFEDGEDTLHLKGYDDVPNCVMRDPGRIGEGRSTAKVDGSSRGMGFLVRVVFVRVA